MQASVLDLLREVTQALGATVIIVTHNIKAAARIAHSIGVMNKGQLVEVGLYRRGYGTIQKMSILVFC